MEHLASVSVSILKSSLCLGLFMYFLLDFILVTQPPSKFLFQFLLWPPSLF